jgi:hypothetical protein
LLNAGSDPRQIELLRRVLAETENLKMLQAISVAVSELAESAAEAVLDEVGELVDRVHDKLERLAEPPPPTPSQRARAPQQGLGADAISMRITAWREEANGVLTRFIYNAADPPPS